MSDFFSLPLRPASRHERSAEPARRGRSRSPDRWRAPLRERNVDLLNAAGTDHRGSTVNLAHRPRQHIKAADIHAWMNNEPMPYVESPVSSREVPANIAPSESESDADDSTVPTIKTFEVPVAMPSVQHDPSPAPDSVRAPYASGRQTLVASQRPTPVLYRPQVPPHSPRSPWMGDSPWDIKKREKAHKQRAHIEAIAIFWGGCPSHLLAPSLIPIYPPSTFPPNMRKYGKQIPTDWHYDIVKGLRLLAPLCSAHEASFWLREELRKERGGDGDSITRFTVRAVYHAFLAKGHEPKTLAQAQKENRERAALLARKPVYDPTKPYFKASAAAAFPPVTEYIGPPYDPWARRDPASYKP